MHLATEINRTPHSYSDPSLSVRATVASLYLARKVSLHCLAQSTEIKLLDRWLILYNARHIESLYRRYSELAEQFKFAYLVINTRILDIAACSIATHYIKGEYEEARQMRADVLSSESELSEIAVFKAREQSETAPGQYNINHAVAA
jgi:hypothetical protein